MSQDRSECLPLYIIVSTESLTSFYLYYGRCPSGKKLRRSAPSSPILKLRLRGVHHVSSPSLMTTCTTACTDITTFNWSTWSAARSKAQSRMPTVVSSRKAQVRCVFVWAASSDLIDPPWTMTFVLFHVSNEVVDMFLAETGMISFALIWWCPLLLIVSFLSIRAKDKWPFYLLSYRPGGL